MSVIRKVQNRHNFLVVTGPSGSGKTREYSGLGFSEQVRFRLLESLREGHQPRLPPRIFETITPGKARRVVMSSTDSPPARDETVASFLGIDTIAGILVKHVKRLGCINCRKPYDRISYPSEAFELVSNSSVGAISITFRNTRADQDETFAADGFVPAAHQGEYLVDASIHALSDRERLRRSMELGFSLKDVVLRCTTEGGQTFYFSSLGVCTWCGHLEPLWDRSFFDFRTLDDDTERVIDLGKSKGMHRAPVEFRRWLDSVPLGNSDVGRITSGTLSNLPLVPETKLLRTAIQKLALAGIPLLARIGAVSTSERTRLILAAALTKSSEGDLVILDGVSLALNGVLIKGVNDLLHELGSTRSIIVIDNHTDLVEDDTGVDYISIATGDETDTLPWNFSGKIVVVRGAPASGKSSYIRSRLQGPSSSSFELTRDSIARIPRKQLVYEFLELDEPLARLFAASIDAKAAGLDMRRFLRNSKTSKNDFCSACRGTGTYVDREQIVPCSVCLGGRAGGVLSTIKYRGLTLLDFWALPIGDVCSILKDLTSYSRYTLGLAHLALNHLPLGAELSAISEGERTKLAILKVITITKAPTTFWLEHPDWRLDEEQLAGLEAFLRAGCVHAHAFIVETQRREFRGDSEIVI